MWPLALLGTLWWLLPGGLAVVDLGHSNGQGCRLTSHRADWVRVFAALLTVGWGVKGAPRGPRVAAWFISLP